MINVAGKYSKDIARRKFEASPKDKYYHKLSELAGDETDFITFVDIDEDGKLDVLV